MSRADPDRRRHRSAGLGAGDALARAGEPVVIGSRSAERAAGGRRSPRPGGARRQGRGGGQRRGRPARADRVPHRPVPRPVREPEQPARGARAGPAPRRLHGPHGRRGQREGHPDARRVAGLGRPAGPGDGPRRGHGGRRPAHGERADRSATRRRTLDEDVLVCGDRRADKARVAANDRADPGAAGRQRRRAGDGADRRADHPAADLDQRPLQDSRGDPDHGAPGRAIPGSDGRRPRRAPRPARLADAVALLAGGTGGAKLAAGMQELSGPSSR